MRLERAAEIVVGVGERVWLPFLQLHLRLLHALRAPIELVTAPHTPVPFNPLLEDLYIPDPARIAEAARRVTGWSR